MKVKLFGNTAVVTGSDTEKSIYKGQRQQRQMRLGGCLRYAERTLAGGCSGIHEVIK
jgi:hypothetical protein